MVSDCGKITIAEIADKFGISPATARRDISVLEKEGRLLRTFGGAQTKEEQSLVVKTFGEKQESMNEAKNRMAEAAAALVRRGMTLMLDSGTTIWAVSRRIKHIVPLTVITSSLAVVEELGAVEGISLFCAGGAFRPSNLDFCGGLTQSAFAQFSADIAFIGVDKLIPGRGGYAVDRESAALIRVMSGHADKRVVLADHSKMQAGGFVLAVESRDIDMIITDAEVSEARRRQLTKHHCRLIVAS